MQVILALETKVVKRYINTIIRNATNSDKEQLRELFKECFGDLAEDGGGTILDRGKIQGSRRY